jgi:hypothetical protein
MGQDVRVMTDATTSAPASAPAMLRGAHPPVVLALGIVLAMIVGAMVAWPLPPNASALVLAWGVWLGAMVWGASRRPVAVAFLGVQGWWALGVLAGGTFAVMDGYAEIGTWRFRGAIADALLLAAVADAAVWAGAVVAHLRVGPRASRAPRSAVPDGSARGARATGAVRPTGSVLPVIERLAVPVPRFTLDVWSGALVAAGIVALALYVVLAGADLSTLNVLTGSARYGDLARSSDGVAVKYLKTLAALAGVGLVAVALRLVRSHTSWLVPALVSVPAVLLLSLSGGRSWLAVPAVAAVLLWIKTSPHPLARRPGSVLLAGGLGLFVLASLIGGVRGQTDEKQVDVAAFAAKEAHGGVFAPTVGLLETVPSSHDPLHGSSYADIVALPVPRFLWPEKPANPLFELQLAVFGKNIGASFGFHGELYANFGLAGVVAGCALFGFALERVWLRFVRTRRLSSAILAVGTLAVLAQLFTRDYVAGQLAGQFGFIVGMVLLARALGRRGRALERHPTSAVRAPAASGVAPARAATRAAGPPA